MSRESKRLREKLLSVIELCKTSKETGLDPFSVDTDYVLSAIQSFYPNVKSLQDFCLDAEAINELSAVIERQGDWIEQQSTSLYKDPFLLEQKLLEASQEGLVQAFLSSWHPIVALEQVSVTALKGSIQYWGDLLPIDKRWILTPPTPVGTSRSSFEDAMRLGLVSTKEFKAELESFWKQLKERLEEASRMKYWDFIGAETYEETMSRAVLTSFLIGYGYAVLEQDRIEEETYIRPCDEQQPVPRNVASSSIPILIDFEEWSKWRRRSDR